MAQVNWNGTAVYVYGDASGGGYAITVDGAQTTGSSTMAGLLFSQQDMVFFFFFLSFFFLIHVYSPLGQGPMLEITAQGKLAKGSDGLMV